MRLLSRAALVLAATVLAFPVQAQTSFSIAAGATLPVGSTADGMDLGYNAIVGLGVKPPLAPIGLRLEGMYSSMAFKNTSSGAMRTMAAIANVTVSGVAMPVGYLIGGIGMYNNKAVNLPAPFTSSNATTDFGFNIGAGLNFPLTGFSTFAEARLHIISTANASTKIVPITFGIRF